ncbi:MAG: RIP metalloprotease RseP, partial [Paraglaciecola sp.]
MLEFLWTVASFVIALGILVAVHEWGHFWVARRCGVKVEKFSIGFGKALWKRTDKLGTEYVVAAIPLGGYVKMLDERVDEVAVEDLPYAFNRQHVLKRIAIVAAGPIVNFLFAIFALFIMYLIGLETVKPVVADIKPESVFSQSNISKNAIITQVGDRKVADWEDVNYELISHIGKDVMNIKWTEANHVIERSTVVNIEAWKFDPDKGSPIASLGLVPFRPAVSKIIGYVQPDSAADAIGLRPNDKILRLDGTTMENWEQIVGYVSSRANQFVKVDVLRGGETVRLEGSIGQKEVEGIVKGYMGFTPTFEAWPAGMLFT